MIPLIIQDQFYIIQNLQRSPITQTNNWSGTFFTVSYSKPALDSVTIWQISLHFFHRCNFHNFPKLQLNWIAIKLQFAQIGKRMSPSGCCIQMDLQIKRNPNCIFFLENLCCYIESDVSFLKILIDSTYRALYSQIKRLKK